MKKYVPILQVLLFLFMLIFLIHYLRNKRDWQDIAKEMNLLEETSGFHEETKKNVQAEENSSSEEMEGNLQSQANGTYKEMERSMSAKANGGNMQAEASGTQEGNLQPGANSSYEGTEGNLQSEANGQDSTGQAEAVQPVIPIQAENIYSFLQGPASWSAGVAWSGEWCRFEVDGNSFGGFGCGLCCMANVYDTLSPYEVSPWDMYENAKIASGYTPGGGYGAIDWEEMRCALEVCGISGELHKKPETFEEFREQIRGVKSAIVLVCSANDNTFWQTTQGHYVNIWLYQEDDTVFLAEPGNREKNRSRIPLRYVYDALKTGSKFQYLLVKDYVQENNMWRADGIDEDWCRPGT